jgi:hypothetical protein
MLEISVKMLLQKVLEQEAKNYLWQDTPLKQYIYAFLMFFSDGYILTAVPFFVDSRVTNASFSAI